MNHGFIDANERVGFAALHVFLRMNGSDLTATAEETLEFVIGALERQCFEKHLLERWLRQHAAPPQPSDP